jgi:hypothetical protein
MKKTDICKQSRLLLWEMLEETSNKEFTEETRITRKVLNEAIGRMQDLHFDMAMKGELE